MIMNKMLALCMSPDQGGLELYFLKFAKYYNNDNLFVACTRNSYISKNIIDKTSQTVKSKEKNSIDRIKQIELSAIQSIKVQASIELNSIIRDYFSNLSENNRAKILDNSVIDLKSFN